MDDSSQLYLGPINDVGSLKERAYVALKRAILQMDLYAVDAQLRLDEREVSARFGISRTPLREAVAQLDQEGLVKIVPRRGIFIVRKSKAEILDMITAWAALESMAARLAAQNATAAELASLHALTDAYNQHEVADHMGEYSDANIAFHGAIIGLSRSPLLVEMTSRLFFHVRAIRQRTISEADRAQRSIADHREIVAALELRETERAESLVRTHTLKLRDHVERTLDIE